MLAQPIFTHLRARTEYSISESTLRLDDMLNLASVDAQGAIAMTDIDAMFGAIRFYVAARDKGIKPILGVDISLRKTGCSQTPRVLFLAKNFRGYQQLLKLISTAHCRDGAGGSSLSIDLDSMIPTQLTDLFCLGGGHQGLGWLLAEPQFNTEAIGWASALLAIFKERFFLEIQRPGTLDDERVIDATIECANKLALPICATHPIQFAKQADYVAHELRVCDQRGLILQDRNRARTFTPYQHFLTQQEMADLFSDFPDALANSVSIAQACNVYIPLGVSVLPDFPVAHGVSLGQALANLATIGLIKRLALSRSIRPKVTTDDAVYEQRLRMELNVISSMGFDGYFMIVQDFIAWAKNNNIPVGPGRGSGAGSLVAYALGITDIDPLAYNLLFERFLNPERVSMPDFDIDFCKEKRELVIQYVAQKYGAASVSGIANINTLQARAAIKAAGRALGMRIQFVNGVSKLIPAIQGKSVTIDSALVDEPALGARQRQEPEVDRLLSMAKSIEGLPTAIGQHAAGLVISPTVIADYAPLYLPEGKVQPVTQYDKDDVEQTGLVKFDFLGLKTLTEIHLAIDFVRTMRNHADFDISTIPLDDPNVYKLFQNGDTHSVFQFESPGMQRLLVEARPESFGDLIALNALYRPGPMDLIPEFIKRKSGLQTVNYLDDRLEPILAETYGIMVYQEQVMQIAQIIGGYSLGGADLLRRAMGKKKAEEMAKHRSIFISGARGKGLSSEAAGTLYDLMEKFAGYGFNKSHAAAYTLLAYQTAYLKHYFPAAFFASWLSIESKEDTASIPALIKDARKHGISVRAPNINASFSHFAITSDGKSLLYGLAGLKGLGEDRAKAVVSNRTTNGNYASLHDIVARLGPLANKKTLDTLIKAGSIDELHPNRAESLLAIPAALKFRKDNAKFYGKIAAALKSKTGRTATPPTPPLWPKLPSQALLSLLDGERDAFGFFFSKHPYEHYQAEIGGLQACESLLSIQNRPADWEQHLIAGVVTDARLIDTKNGRMLIAQIGDGDVEIEVKAFSSVAKKISDWFKKDAFALMLVHLRENRQHGGISIQVSDAKPHSEAKVLLMESIHILLPPSDLPELFQRALSQQGPTPLYAWHPSSNGLVRSTAPYAYVKRTQACFDFFIHHYHDNCSLSFLRSKPASLGG